MPAYKVSDGMRKPSTDPPRTALTRALTLVLPGTLIMGLAAASPLFSQVTTELGLGHYAERGPDWLPEWLPMPLNTVVNAGYTLCALYWAFFIAEANRSGLVKCPDAFFFFVFNLLGGIYGFVQLYRILMQSQASAVLDQWYTLPLFMMVFVWAQHFRGRGTKTSFHLFMFLSLASYLLALISEVGFEIALGFHMVMAVGGGVLLYRQYPSEDTLQYFLLALLNCSGFVILKLLDHSLLNLHYVFGYISGHFLSKICDILQFHFVNEFFFGMVFNKGVFKSSPEKVKMN